MSGRREKLTLSEVLASGGKLMRSLYPGSPSHLLRKRYISTDHYFRAVFRLPRLKNAVFSGTLETDGVSLSVHYLRKKRRDRQQREDKAVPGQKRDPTPHVHIPADKRVIANDPGRNTIFYGVEETTEGGRHFHRFTRNQYYNTAHFNRSQRKAEKWQAKDSQLKAALEELSSVTLRTSKLSASFFCSLSLSEKTPEMDLTLTTCFTPPLHVYSQMGGPEEVPGRSPREERNPVELLPQAEVGPPSL